MSPQIKVFVGLDVLIRRKSSVSSYSVSISRSSNVSTSLVNPLAPNQVRPLIVRESGSV